MLGTIMQRWMLTESMPTSSAAYELLFSDTVADAL